jgi:simple sugar transport system permease protein
VAVTLGHPAPVAVSLAALLFGLAEAAGFRLQGVGLPRQATDAAPYVVNPVALFLPTARRRRRTADSPTGAVT